MRELPKVMAGIEASVRPGNKDGQLAAYLKELEFSSLLVTSLPDDFVAAAIRLLRDDAFLLLPDSWLLVGFLNNNWGLLTLEHRNKVNPILLKAFDRFGDWMGAFVISEILGERYCDEASLEALREPHGNLPVNSHRMALNTWLAPPRTMGSGNARKGRWRT